MKKLSNIIIIIVMVFATLILYFSYIALPLASEYSPLDKSCNVDSDCEIISAKFCGFLCAPDDNDVYNKQTVAKIREWRGNPYKSGVCPIADCVAPNVSYVPKCVNNLCVIEKIPNVYENLTAQSYTACGCGCCVGIESIEQCLYHSQGNSIEKIMEDDKKAKENPQCAISGCSRGIKYSYCD